MKVKYLKFIKSIVLIGVCMNLLPAFAQPASAASLTVQGNLIKLSNSHYEIALNTTDGAIMYIIDKATHQHLSEGSVDSSLWQLTLDHNGEKLASSTYNGHFDYKLDPDTKTLTLNYKGDVDVTVTLVGSDDTSLKLQAALTNNSKYAIKLFSFPNALKVVTSSITDALLPMMPGAQLSTKYFTKRETFVGVYPGVMFADYLALHSKRGNLALYTVHDKVLQPAQLGFEHDPDDKTNTKVMHNYKTWIDAGKTWSTPWLVAQIGRTYPETIASYRTDNGIDKFKSLSEKLGSAAPMYHTAPMYKLDFMKLGIKTFTDYKNAAIDKLNFPGIIHFVAFQSRGHDENYPEFIPPDPKWGTTEQFADLVSYLKSKGNLAIPYTNFSWWDNERSTLSSLPEGLTLNDVLIKEDSGLYRIETYATKTGFVVNLHNKFVKDKITEQHKMLVDTVGMDGIFEDQWGARATVYDFNPAGLDTYDPATSYFEGILEHYRDHASDHLMTEVGVDLLAENGIGFMGTNYLWDMLGARGTTAAYTTYYPMAGMLLRDKVLFYQHDLAAETWTKNKDMLRWNLAQGYNLSNAFLDSTTNKFNMDNPWLNLVGVFQKYALANYANELVQGFDDLRNGVRKTTFATYTVYSNWNADKPYKINGYTLPGGGVMTQANDGTVTAGLFSAYNKKRLSDGEHYLVEVRSTSAVKIFQPVGTDTALSIKPPAGSTFTVIAYKYDGTLIGKVEATTSSQAVSFDYISQLNGKPVGYYEITGS